MLKDSYAYGFFKATIKMNVDTSYSLGAFWLWDVSSNRNSIVMEIFKNSSNYTVSCQVHYDDSTYTNAGTYYTTSTNPNSAYIEYGIYWTSDKIEYYFNGTKIHEITDDSIIPSVPLNLAYSYRMTPWTGPIWDCDPDPPDDDIEYKVEWAAW